MKNRVLLIIIALLTVLSIMRNSVWRDEFTLAMDNISKSPNNPRQIYNYALFLHRQGRYEEAIKHLRRIIEMGRQTWFVYAELGAVLADMGLYNDALYWQKKALEMENNADAWEFIGVTYMMMGEKERAKESFQNALRLNRDSHLANYYLELLEKEGSGDF